MATYTCKGGMVAMVIMVLSGCAGGYNAESDCTEGSACLWSLGYKTYTIPFCTIEAQDDYDTASPDEQKSIDDAFEACSSLSKCAYVRCMCDYFSSNSDLCVEVRNSGSP